MKYKLKSYIYYNNLLQIILVKSKVEKYLNICLLMKLLFYIKNKLLIKKNLNKNFNFF